MTKVCRQAREASGARTPGICPAKDRPRELSSVEFLRDHCLDRPWRRTSRYSLRARAYVRTALVALRVTSLLRNAVMLLAIDTPALAILGALDTTLLTRTHVTVRRRIGFAAVHTRLPALELSGLAVGQ